MAPVGPQIQALCPGIEVVEGQRLGLAGSFATMAAPQGEVNLSPRRGTIPLVVDAWLEHGIVPTFRADECEVCVSLATAEEIAASIA
jgi:hypothetical protein